MTTATEQRPPVRIFTGVCAEARVEGTVDGYHGRPTSGPNARVRRYHGLAREVYIEAYREYARPGQQLALF